MKIEELLNHFRKDDTVISPSHSKKRGGRKTAMGERPFQDKRSRKDTETLIKNRLKEVGHEMTITQLAYDLERTASPHFRKIVEGMVERGELIQTADLAPNERMFRFWYKLP